MRTFGAFLVMILMVISACAQPQKRLVKIEPIEDISETPIYAKLSEQKGGEPRWKASYAYLDSIEMNRLTYLSDGLKVKGLLVKPKGSGPYPCVIFNRGGNRDFGALKIAHAVTLLGKLASRGYVVVASNYRGNGGGEGTEEFGGADVNDVLHLMEVLAEIEGADTSKIGMYGWSRGGMMTYLALARTDKIDAAVVGAAPADLTQIDRPEMEEKVYAELIPNYWENKEAELRKRSAVFWAEKLPKNAPILLLHGDADPRVNVTNSTRMAAELEKHGIPHRLKIYEGGDHGLSQFRTEVEKEVAAWFAKYLKE